MSLKYPRFHFGEKGFIEEKEVATINAQIEDGKSENQSPDTSTKDPLTRYLVFEVKSWHSSFDVYGIDEKDGIVGIANAQCMFFYLVGDSYPKPIEFKLKAPEGSTFTAADDYSDSSKHLLVVFPNFATERKILVTYDAGTKVIKSFYSIHF